MPSIERYIELHEEEKNLNAIIVASASDFPLLLNDNILNGVSVHQATSNTLQTIMEGIQTEFLTRVQNRLDMIGPALDAAMVDFTDPDDEEDPLDP